MLIMGIDPGLERTGWAVLKIVDNNPMLYNYGIIKQASSNIYVKMANIMSKVQFVVNENKPNLVVLEKIFLGKNVTSAFKLGQVRGVIMAVAALAKLKIIECNAVSAKKNLTNYGKASKDQILNAVNLIFSSKLSSYDICDAVALAMWGAKEFKISKLKKINFND